MSRTAVLSDVVWEQIEPLLPSSEGRRGRPFRDHRQVVKGIVYRYRTGIPCGTRWTAWPWSSDLVGAGSPSDSLSVPLDRR